MTELSAIFLFFSIIIEIGGILYEISNHRESAASGRIDTRSR